MTRKREITQKAPSSASIRGGLSEQLLDYLVHWYVQLYGNLVLSDKNMLFQGVNQQDIQLILRPEHFTCEGMVHLVATEVQVCHNVHQHVKRARMLK